MRPRSLWPRFLVATRCILLLLDTGEESTGSIPIQLSPKELAEHPLRRIHRAVAISGLQTSIWSIDPGVEVGVWEHPNGCRLVLAMNHAPLPLTTNLMSLKKWGSISPCIRDKVPRVLDENRLELSLEPCEVVGLICRNKEE